MKACWKPGYSARYDEPWFRALPVEDRRRFQEQDIERSEINRRIKIGQATDEEYFACCRSQVAENMARSSMMRGMPGVPKPEFNPDREILRKARQELGLEATERFPDGAR